MWVRQILRAAWNWVTNPNRGLDMSRREEWGVGIAVANVRYTNARPQRELACGCDEYKTLRGAWKIQSMSIDCATHCPELALMWQQIQARKNQER